MWFTLVRFKETPQNLKGVAQAKTAADALSLTESWEQEFPDETTVVFDPKNLPINRKALVELSGRVETSNQPLIRSR